MILPNDFHVGLSKELPFHMLTVIRYLGREFSGFNIIKNMTNKYCLTRILSTMSTMSSPDIISLIFKDITSKQFALSHYSPLSSLWFVGQ